ncbi:MAG: hypothetical protein V4731_01365 [Pseudomonadota bacterium]
MPLPKQPTQRPVQSQANLSRQNKADQDVLIKALLCLMIGLIVLVTPYFVHSPGMAIVVEARIVGWFSLVLGLGFGVVYARRRAAAAARSGPA